nr:putative reverse transcriptase domain-containing protein [Tanacetum cinerariifolium]
MHVALSSMKDLKRMLHVTNILSAGKLTTPQMVLNSPCLTHIKNWLVQIKWSLFKVSASATISVVAPQLTTAAALTLTTTPSAARRRNSIKYALTVKPNIYVSCIKQIWTTVAVKTVNDVIRLQALVDKKKVVGMSYDDICLIFEAKFNSNVAFLQKTKEEIKEEESRALKRINETPAERAAKRQKEDLEALWSLVKERFSTSKPKSFSDDFLLVTLRAMFEKPDMHAQIWKNQRSVHGPAKLILLVERKYPLTRFALDQMLNNVRLEVKEESNVSLELLRSRYALSSNANCKPIRMTFPRHSTGHNRHLQRKVDTINHDGEWTEAKDEGYTNEVQAVSFYPRTEPVEPLEWKASKNWLNPSSVEPPKLELKELLEHLEYAFLQENNKLPVVISSALSATKKAKLLDVLKNYKGAIAWSITDIKGIDSSFYTHKILMEDEFKPSFLPQRRVNPNIKEVVKKEVIKLLNARLIYLISDSPWVSPVQVIPNKRGMAVVKNEKDKLIP